MNELPPFAKKYVSATYYNQLTWNEKAAYLRGIQDVMDVFSKDLENRAMQVLQRKAHWLEPRGAATTPVEYSFSQRSTAFAAPTPTSSQQTAAKTTTAATSAAGSAGVTAAAIAALNAAVKTAQSASASQLSQHSTQSSQLLKSTQSSSQPSQKTSQSSTTSQPHLKRKTTEATPLDTEITFVGMKYRSGHVFSPSDQVRLERDHKNPVDKNAIKVMVLKNGTWFHAAYVGREDASSLKDQLGIEHMKLTYLRAYLASVKYRLQA
ncbi:hypothetical protein BGW39_011918 [Mortierella sp. 14UC]|nr:hypothetical protein BGW39_011918 [Mortierella sp. 14UC]